MLKMITIVVMVLLPGAQQPETMVRTIGPIEENQCKPYADAAMKQSAQMMKQLSDQLHAPDLKYDVLVFCPNVEYSEKLDNFLGEKGL